MSAAQLFGLVPRALTEAYSLDSDKVVVSSIVPYDTTEPLGYITSQVRVSFPDNMVQQLRTDIKIPSAPLYRNRDVLVQNMTNQINPAIDIIIGSTLDGTPDSSGDESSSSTSNPNNDPFTGSGEGEEQTSGQKAKTAGIAVGALGVAAAYGASMFVIARRYKRKKQKHQRASSITNPSEMREAASPALMGGALLPRDFTAGGYGATGGNMRDSQGSGRSGMNSSTRTALISAPVAAENSLGWN